MNETQIITISDHTKLKGINIDSDLSSQTHIQGLHSKLSSNCYSLRILTKYLDLNAVKTAYYCNFYSFLKYGIIFWGQSIHFNKIFKIQKKAIRIIFKMGLRDTCRGVFKKNKLLTATGIYIHECVLFLKKHADIFEDSLIDHVYDTRNNIVSYRYPQHRLSLKEKGTYYSCLKFYNLLPNSVRDIPTLVEFKQSLFEYLCNVEPYTLQEFCNLPRGH